MTFALKETTAPEDVAPLAGEKKAGTRIYAFRVDPADYAAIRAAAEGVSRREGAQSRVRRMAPSASAPKPAGAATSPKVRC